MKLEFLLGIVAATAACAVSGCAVTCVEDGSGKRCSVTGAQRYDGAIPPLQTLERAPGAGVIIDVTYGDVLVQRSTSGKLEVQFSPFMYGGKDSRAQADQEIAQNLRLSATSAGGVSIAVRREGGSSGLGANTLVRLPDDFDGPLTIVNHGKGSLNHFDVRVDYVGRATAVNLTNHSELGDCWLTGAPSVRSTTVDCGEDISVYDVSDALNITNRDAMHDDDTPAVSLRLAAVSSGSPGGRVTTASGAIKATFPRAGAYTINAQSAVQGRVRHGQPPANCQVQASSARAKTIRCGGGSSPTYELIAGTNPNHPGQARDSDVMIQF